MKVQDAYKCLEGLEMFELQQEFLNEKSLANLTRMRREMKANRIRNLEQREEDHSVL